LQEIMRRFLIVSLCIYGVGVALSQSLMSLGGTMFSALFFWEFLSLTKERQWSTLSRGSQLAIATGVIYVAISLIHLFWGEDASSALEGIKNIPLFLVPLCALMPKTRKALQLEPPDNNFWPLSLKAPIFLTVCGYLISFFWAVYQIKFQQKSYATGAFGNPIYYAYNLLPAIAFFTYVTFRESRPVRNKLFLNRKTWLWFIVSTLILSSLVLSGSRVAIAVGLFSWIICTLLLCLDWRRFTVFILIMFGLYQGGLKLYKSDTVIGWKFRSAVRRKVVNDRSWKLREILWNHSWELYKENPWLGVGYAQNFIDTSRDTQYADNWKSGHHIYAHSIYLQSLAESGSIGSALHLTSYIGLALAAPTTLPVMAVVAAGGITENIFHNSKALHSFLFFLLLSGLLRRSDRVKGAKD